MTGKISRFSWFAILATAALGILGFSEIATVGWYGVQSGKHPRTEPWALDFEKIEPGSPGFSGLAVRELGETEKELLRFQDARAASWTDSQGRGWVAFHIKWPRDKRLNNMDIAHNPTICLPAVGLRLVSALPEVDLEVDGDRFPFSAWEFERDGRKFFVYIAVRRYRDFDRITYGSKLNQKRVERLKKVLAGNRENPLESLQMIVMGADTQEEANALLARQLESIVRASGA